MTRIKLIPKPEFDRVNGAAIGKYDRLKLLADMCRVNTLTTVKCAGSGHLGSSFSSLDIVTYLYYSLINVREQGLELTRWIDLTQHYPAYQGRYAKRTWLWKIRRASGSGARSDEPAKRHRRDRRTRLD